MDGPRDCPTEWSQREKDKHHITAFIHEIQKKNGTNELIYKTESQMQKTNLWLPRGKRQGGMNYETGIDIYTITYKIDN